MKQKIVRSKLGKNITVVTDALPGVSSATIGFWMDRGSRDEKESDMGLSHLYEHMIFKGTKKRTPVDIAKTLERSGGSLNAFTGKEQVCLHARFVDEELDTACDLIRDVFENSLFDEVELEKERNVVLEEIRGCEDNPEEFVHDAIMECLWPDHPLGWPITGRVHHVKSFRRNDIVRMHDLMRSNRIVVAASGNISHDELCRQLKPLSLNTVSLPPRKLGKMKPPVRRSFVRSTQQANVSVAFRVPEFTNSDKYPLFVLNAILGDGMSSRLFQNIRERLGLAYSVYSFLEANSDSGVMGVFLGADPANVEPALKSLFEELNSIRSKGILKEEMEFAKTYLRGNVLIGLESTGNRMGQIARSELYRNKAENIELTLKKIDLVKPVDIVRVANKYLTDANMAICAAAPKMKGMEAVIKKSRFK
ncbi:MAG: insulinase family protein [Fibrobacteres bacterium]|nr:insulinase family protein [Fibrobacterota bacterium]